VFSVQRVTEANKKLYLLKKSMFQTVFGTKVHQNIFPFTLCLVFLWFLITLCAVQICDEWVPGTIITRAATDLNTRSFCWARCCHSSHVINLRRTEHVRTLCMYCAVLCLVSVFGALKLLKCMINFKLTLNRLTEVRCSLAYIVSCFVLFLNEIRFFYSGDSSLKKHRCHSYQLNTVIFFPVHAL
jgi:hypothetical protein